MNVAPVTIVIPCYNGARFLVEALESCIDQTIAPARILVIDDASTDNSLEILEDYERRGIIDLFRNQKNLGKPSSINQAIDAIDTDFIMLLDQDDICEPERVARQVSFMDQDPQLGCSSSFVTYVNERNKPLATGSLDLVDDEALGRYLGGDDPFGLFCPATIIRTSVVRNPSMRFRSCFWPAEDIDLWNRIAEAGFKVRAQPEALVRYRIHGESFVTKQAKKTREQFEYVRMCLRYRRRGIPEPTKEEFLASIQEMSWSKRLNRIRKIDAKASYRAAGYLWGNGNKFRGVIFFIRALAMDPMYSWQRYLNHRIRG